MSSEKESVVYVLQEIRSEYDTSSTTAVLASADRNLIEQEKAKREELHTKIQSAREPLDKYLAHWEKHNPYPNWQQYKPDIAKHSEASEVWEQKRAQTGVLFLTEEGFDDPDHAYCELDRVTPYFRVEAVPYHYLGDFPHEI